MRINVGERLRAERKARNLSQADLERRCGLPRCRISWLENGRAIPTIETLEKIADALGLPVYRMLYDGDELIPAVDVASRIAGNGYKGRERKSEFRLFGEIRKHLSRMGREDQQLLLAIARILGRRVGAHSVFTLNRLVQRKGEAMRRSGEEKNL